MRWIIVSFLASCSLMTILSSASVPIEQTSSYAWIQLLHLDDCEFPCWIHIESGTTTLSEAQTQVETVYADTSLYDVTRGEDYYKIVYRPNGYQVRIWFRSDNGSTSDKSLIRVVYLELGVDTGTEIKRPTTDDLEVFLGEPEMVRLSSGVETPTITLIYRNDRVYTTVDDLECDKVHPNQEAPSISLYENPPAYIAWLSEPQRWFGYNYCYNFERILS